MKRPDFQKMLAAIERKMFDVVLTKDLSRMGRNYLQVDQLPEDFPQAENAVHRSERCC